MRPPRLAFGASSGVLPERSKALIGAMLRLSAFVWLSLDVKTIQRLFMKETGMTFGQWRQQARLLRALELLADGEKIIDIALRLGYDSPGAFATMFRKHFGQTPSQFFAEP